MPMNESGDYSLKVDKVIGQLVEGIGGNIRSLQNPVQTSVTCNKPKDCVVVDLVEENETHIELLFVYF